MSFFCCSVHDDDGKVNSAEGRPLFVGSFCATGCCNLLRTDDGWIRVNV